MMVVSFLLFGASGLVLREFPMIAIIMWIIGYKAFGAAEPNKEEAIIPALFIASALGVIATLIHAMI